MGRFTFCRKQNTSKNFFRTPDLALRVWGRFAVQIRLNGGRVTFLTLSALMDAKKRVGFFGRPHGNGCK